MNYPAYPMFLVKTWEDQVNFYKKYLTLSRDPDIYELKTISKLSNEKTVDHFNHDGHWQKYYCEDKLIYHFFECPKENYIELNYKAYDKPFIQFDRKTIFLG